MYNYIISVTFLDDISVEIKSFEELVPGDDDNLRLEHILRYLFEYKTSCVTSFHDESSRRIFLRPSVVRPWVLLFFRLVWLWVVQKNLGCLLTPVSRLVTRVLIPLRLSTYVFQCQMVSSLETPSVHGYDLV